MKKIIICDRYSVLPYNGCKGLCEGTGYVPVKRGERDKVLRRLWQEAEKEKPSDDGWHFVRCPDCTK